MAKDLDSAKRMLAARIGIGLVAGCLAGIGAADEINITDASEDCAASSGQTPASAACGLSDPAAALPSQADDGFSKFMKARNYQDKILAGQKVWADGSGNQISADQLQIEFNNYLLAKGTPS